MEYRFKLERGSKKFLCPSCHKKRMVRYEDLKTNTRLPEIYGKCDRIENCGYHLSPYKDGYSKRLWEVENGSEVRTNIKRIVQDKPKAKKKKPVLIPFDAYKTILSDYDKNSFIRFLLEKAPFPFLENDIERVISMYYLGTVTKGYLYGAVSFPYIDTNQGIRYVQLKQFDNQNKTKATGSFASQLKETDPEWFGQYNRQDLIVSTLFGAHLLSKYPNNPIALVEAPKTAIYGTLYFGFPECQNDFLWLAVFNLTSLSLEKCRVLKGRRVVLFPDLSSSGHAYKLWKEKANVFQSTLRGSTFIVSDLLELNASGLERENGGDLADFLIKQDWRKFRDRKPVKNKAKEGLLTQSETCSVTNDNLSKQSIKEQILNAKKIKGKHAPTPEELTFFQNIQRDKKGGGGQKDDWSPRIEKAKTSLESLRGAIKTKAIGNIADAQTFLRSHLSIIEAKNGQKGYLPYLLNLESLIQEINEV